MTVVGARAPGSAPGGRVSARAAASAAPAGAWPSRPPWLVSCRACSRVPGRARVSGRACAPIPGRVRRQQRPRGARWQQRLLGARRRRPRGARWSGRAGWPPGPVRARAAPPAPRAPGARRPPPDGAGARSRRGAAGPAWPWRRPGPAQGCCLAPGPPHPRGVFPVARCGSPVARGRTGVRAALQAGGAGHDWCRRPGTGRSWLAMAGQRGRQARPARRPPRGADGAATRHGPASRRSR